MTNPEREVTIDDIRTSITIAGRRFDAFAKSAESAGDATAGVWDELKNTILPLVQDTAALIDRLEAFAEWASEQISNEDSGSDESQLTEEDAARFAAFIGTVVEQCDAGLADLDPETQHARALKLMRDEGQTLLAYTKEITLTDVEDGPDDSGSDVMPSPEEQPDERN